MKLENIPRIQNPLLRRDVKTEYYICLHEGVDFIERKVCGNFLFVGFIGAYHKVTVPQVMFIEMMYEH